MKELLSPKQVARAIGVSEASVKRWCDKGKLPTIRTVGGHRRIPINGVMNFLRERGHPLVKPEVLGLPSTTGKGDGVMDRAASRYREALEKGNSDQCRQIAIDLYLAGNRMADICDKVLAHAFHVIGDRWAHGDVEVYQERLGCEITSRVLFELSMAVNAPDADAPTAIGGTLEHDPYILPITMIELSLREAGWVAQSLGSGHPCETLCAAVRHRRPKLMWLSVSATLDDETLRQNVNKLYDCCSENQTALAVGGRALSPARRCELRFSAHCDNIAHLVTFADTLKQAPAARREAENPQSND